MALPQVHAREWVILLLCCHKDIAPGSMSFHDPPATPVKDAYSRLHWYQKTFSPLRPYYNHAARHLLVADHIKLR